MFMVALCQTRDGKGENDNMKPLKYTKTADLIAKISCVVGAIFMIAYFCVEVMYGLGYIKTETIRIISIISFMIPGVIVLIYP